MNSITINSRTRDLTLSACRLFMDPTDADRIANMSSFTVLGFSIRVRSVSVWERLTSFVAGAKDMIVSVYDHATGAVAELRRDFDIV